MMMMKVVTLGFCSFWWSARQSHKGRERKKGKKRKCVECEREKLSGSLKEKKKGLPYNP